MFLMPYSWAMALQILTPSYVATNVIENCGLLPHCMFASNWFELDHIEKKGVLLFTTRAIRPFIIRAGSLFQMNINTFLKVNALIMSILH